MNGQLFYQKLTRDPKLATMNPHLAAFFKDYLTREKATKFKNKWVINTHLPPYPSVAFDSLIQHFQAIGHGRSRRRLFSVTLALTNRCPYNCWHCYNAGRTQQDMSLSQWQTVIRDMQNLHVTSVTLSGGEPLLRKDLTDIMELFDERCFLSLNTTGFGLTLDRARNLKEAGLFSLGVSLDAVEACSHDRLRGKEGAFQAALTALDLAEKAGLYPYVIATATHDLLQPEIFSKYWAFIKTTPAREVHLLEPCASGKLAGQGNQAWTERERQHVLDMQAYYAAYNDEPTLSTFAYLEGAQAFGCGAGLTHLYIDGGGEVCPCNLVPLSFGNVQTQALETILSEMAPFFQRARTCCIGQTLNPYVTGDSLPLAPEQSKALCSEHLPKQHAVPRAVTVQEAMNARVGVRELQTAYDEVHNDYDQFWLDRAAAPVDDLLARLQIKGHEQIFEAGCGTGYATKQLAQVLSAGGKLTAVDLSEHMIARARKRICKDNIPTVTFFQGDALHYLQSNDPYDLIFSSWVLGYIPLRPFFVQAARALKVGGQLAFLVHRQNSPARELGIFRDLVAQKPEALRQDVTFDFPTDRNQVEDYLAKVHLCIDQIWEGKVVFTYRSPKQVLDHLLKSGAGTVYDRALDPAYREKLHAQFLEHRAATPEADGTFQVNHDYVACLARKQSLSYVQPEYLL